MWRPLLPVSYQQDTEIRNVMPPRKEMGSEMLWSDETVVLPVPKLPKEDDLVSELTTKPTTSKKISRPSKPTNGSLLVPRPRTLRPRAPNTEPFPSLSTETSSFSSGFAILSSSLPG